MAQNDLERRFLDRLSNNTPRQEQLDRGPVSKAPLSQAQLGMWLVDQLSPGGTDYVVTAAARLQGQLDIAALESAFTALVARHHILRTRYSTGDDGEPVQIVGPPWAVEAEFINATGADDFETVARAAADRPFDLAEGRPMRVSVISGAGDDAVLLVVFHHIAVDGHALSVLAEELPPLYEEATTGRSADLPEVQVQYAEFAQRQHAKIDAAAADRHLAYWKDRLSGLVPLELPTDRPRPKVAPGEGDVVTFGIGPEAAEKLRRLAAAQGCSLFIAGLAAFQMVLARWGRTEDLAVGCPVSVRNHADIAETVGFFLNTLVMRADLSGDPTFLEFLDRVRCSALDAYANQELPFERLVEELAPGRGLDRHPLFQVMFAVEAASGGAEWTLPGLDALPFDVPQTTAKFDLSCTLTERSDGGLKGSLVFATALFDRTTINRLAGHLVTVIESAVADPETRVSTMSILPPEERQQLLVGFNDTARPHGDLVPVHRLFEQQAACTPDAVALVFGDDTLTYAALDSRANRVAHRLIECGVRCGDRVGVCLERSADLISGLLGVLKAGAAYVPLDPDHPHERLLFMYEDAGADLILAHAATAERTPGGRDCVLFVDDSDANDPVAAPGVPTALDDLAYIIYTSGSTGTPKGVANHHRGVANRLLWGQRTFSLSPADVVVQKTPYSFDVSFWEMFWPLITGARLVVAEPGGHRDSDYLSWLLARHEVTTAHFVPSMLREFLNATDLDSLPELRQVFCSGEALPTDVAHRFLNAGGRSRSLHNLYGPTEASIEVSHWECDGTETGPSLPIGKPIDNTELFVIDAHGGLSPVGVPGELWIAGVAVAVGYWNNPALTRERFVPHPFSDASDARAYRTGDLVRQLPSGDVEFLGRMDHQMKLRGLRIEPGEIESVLERHGTVVSAVVELREDRKGDQRLVAYCVPVEGRGLDTAELRSWCRTALPGYMVPASFVALAALPVNQSGKVDRRALPEPNHGHLALTGVYAPPTTECENLFAAIWADVLGVERVGIHDDFFELGGHSLLATKAAGRIAADTGSRVGVRDIFLRPTVASLAAGFDTGDGSEQALAPSDRSKSSGVSFAQRRLWYLDQLAPGSHEYVIPHVLRVRGNLDLSALEAAFRSVLDRHEVLRSRFATGTDGEPIQVVDASAEFGIDLVDLIREEHAGAGAAERGQIALSLAHQAAKAPFDLAADQLLRAMVVRLGEQDYILVVAMHHIVSDGWSTEILTRELQEFYTAARSGAPADVPELPVQFADYAEWQRHRITDTVLERDLRYWRERIADAPVLELPADYDRPLERTGSGDEVQFAVPAETVRKLTDIASDCGATLFMATLAAFDLLLSRYCGQDDVVVGSPIAGRTRPEVENLIGFFVNTIVLRTDLSGDPTFDELIVRVRDVALSAYEHQELPFEHLVEELAPNRSSSWNPMFNVSFALQNYAAGRWDLPGATVEPVEIGTSVATVDLSLFLTELPDGGLEGELVFATELFDATTAERIAARFLRVLEQVAENPGLRVSGVDLFTSGEWKQVQSDGNGATVVGIDDYPLHRLVEAQAAERPDATAVVCGADALTYAQLNERANRLARHLRGRGVGTESLVGVFLPRGPELITSILAVLKSGGAYVPLDIDDPADRVRFLVEDTAPTLLVTDIGMSGTLPETGVPALIIDETGLSAVLSREESRDLPLYSSPENLAYVMYTSGSSGAPKGVMVEHRSVNSLITGSEYAPISANDVIAQATSFTFDPFTFECWGALTRGAALVVLPKDVVLSADELRNAITRYGVSFLILTSALFNQHITDRPDLGAGVATLMYGGEAVDRGPADALAHSPWAPDRVVQAYGPTEATVITTFNVGNKGNRRRPHVPIGRPGPGRYISVVDPAGAPVPVGVPGELVVGGPGVARGYWDRPELTAERFGRRQGADGRDERTYRTGDLVKWLPDGQLEFLRRRDSQVKVRGQRIEPGEIEKVLADDPAVASAAVIVHGDASTSKQLVAYCAPARGYRTDPARLRSRCQQVLPPHMLPSGYVELPALPMTSNGKTDRAALAARTGDRFARGGEYVAPRSNTEEIIADVWGAVLGVDAVGVHDNFFELGGHSMQIVRIVNRLRSAGVDLNVKDLLRHQTIDALAQAASAPTKAASLAVRLASGNSQGAQRPLFCIHPGGGSSRWYIPLAGQLTGTFSTYGIEAVGLDGSEPPLDRIPDIAARYWKEIDSVHGSGPHLLLGWSYGGTVVQEMSRQRPDDVETAFLLEPPALEAGVAERLRGFADGYREADRLWQAGQHASGAERREVEQRLRDTAVGLEVPQDVVSLDEWLPFRALGLLYDAAFQHRPAPSKAHTVLFVSEDVRAAAEGSPYSSGDYSAYIAYWKAVSPRALRVVDLPQSHMDMVAEAAPLSVVVREVMCFA